MKIYSKQVFTGHIHVDQFAPEKHGLVMNGRLLRTDMNTRDVHKTWEEECAIGFGP